MPLSLALALIVGPILRDGMFIDGLVYTNIAKNLAAGVGTLWAPLVDAGGPVFYGHPAGLPLLESGFFRLFGNHPYTEDLYNFTVFALTVLLQWGIWRQLAPPRWRGLFFFPLLLFVLGQEVQLRYPNTLLECGLTAVALATVYVFLRLRERSPVVAALVCGAGAFLAFLAKGPVGLFPLAVPLLYGWLAERRWRTADLLLPPLALAGCAGLLVLAQPAALDFFVRYVDHQVLASLRGDTIENVAGSRWSLLIGLVKSNVPAIVLCLLLLGVRAVRGEAHPAPGPARALLTIGAAALLPLAVSPKLAAYYQLPSLPFLCLGLGLLLAPRVAVVRQYFMSRRRAAWALVGIAGTGLLVSTLYALSLYGTVDRRDRVPLQQAAAIDRLMDSLALDRYRLIVTGDRRAFDSGISYTLPGSLNRHYDIYEDHAGASPVALVLRTENGTFPLERFTEIYLREEDVLLGRLGPE